MSHITIRLLYSQPQKGIINYSNLYIRNFKANYVVLVSALLTISCTKNAGQVAVWRSCMVNCTIVLGASLLA